MNDRDQLGFSLIELLMAMAVTLVITGSIVGLLAVGQTAFSTQPEQTERQQNLRIALNAIAEDVMQAGSSLPVTADVFEAGKDQVGPMGAHGELTDELWVLRATDCAAVRICLVDGDTDAFTREPIPEHGCLDLPNLVFVVGASSTPGIKPLAMAARFATWSNVSGPNFSQCTPLGGPDNGHLTFTTANGAAINTGTPFLPFAVGELRGFGSPGYSKFETESGYIVGAQRVAYRISAGADGIPNLERGQMLKDLTMFWEPIARGIDDLQVEYLQGDPYDAANTGVFAAEPVAVRLKRPGPAPAPEDKWVDPTSLVRQVRVRVSGRSIAERAQGGTISQVMEIVINPITANAAVGSENHES